MKKIWFYNHAKDETMLEGDETCEELLQRFIDDQKEPDLTLGDEINCCVCWERPDDYILFTSLDNISQIIVVKSYCELIDLLKIFSDLLCSLYETQLSLSALQDDD